MLYLFSGLCPNFYPDEVCRGNYTLHSYDPPLLYNLHSDPGEIYTLDVKEYSDVMKQIEMVSCAILTLTWVVCVFSYCNLVVFKVACDYCTSNPLGTLLCNTFDCVVPECIFVAQ